MLKEENYQLIIGKLLHELTEEEEKNFETWLNENQENLALFEYYNRLFSRTRELYHTGEPDIESCLKQLSVLPRRHPVLRNIFRYAALFLLPLTLGIFCWYILNDKKSPETETIAQATPSIKNIRLILASGETVELARDSFQKIFDRNGNTIQHMGDTLDYSKVQNNNIQGTASQIKYNTLTVPRGAEYFLILADSSRVWMNAESELKYPTIFSDTCRRVFLKGEAYFEIAHIKTQPFYVETGDISVKVLGTSFNITAYDHSDIETTLEQGEVQVSAPSGKINLSPGMQAVYSPVNRTLNTSYVNTTLFTSWKDRTMLFEKIRLEDLLEKMSRWYDVDIFYYNPECKEILLTGNISRHEDIKTILGFLETMGKVHFSIHEKTITVMKKTK